MQEKAYLAIDVGNSTSKAVLENAHGQLVWFAPLMPNHVQALQPQALYVGIVQSGECPPWLAAWLKEVPTDSVAQVSAQTPLPFNIRYTTPGTLGADRIANVAGARELSPNGPVLVVSLGTALTCDVLDAHNNYLGGSISPGWRMRLMALSHYTARLPDASPHPMPTETPPGQSSLSSLQVGAYHGIIAEAQYWIDYYRDLFGPSLYAVVTGRDSEVFEKNLKSVNFATPFLALHGTLSLMRRRFQ